MDYSQYYKKWTFTNTIIIITVLAFIVQNILHNGGVLMGLNFLFFKFDLYHQLLTTMFAHADLMHLVMNMFMLFIFGNDIENHVGKKQFLILYLVGGLLTSIFSLVYMLVTGDWANLVGASGAICVLMGYVAHSFPHQRQTMIVWVAIMSFAPLLIGMNIAWYAHLIGLAVGFSLGKFLR